MYGMKKTRIKDLPFPAGTSIWPHVGTVDRRLLTSPGQSGQRYRGAHQQWIYTKVFNSEMNLWGPEWHRQTWYHFCLKKAEISEDQDCSSGHHLQPQNTPVSNDNGLQVLARTTHDRPASFWYAASAAQQPQPSSALNLQTAQLNTWPFLRSVLY